MFEQDKAMEWLAVLEQVGRRDCMRPLYPGTRENTHLEQTAKH